MNYLPQIGFLLLSAMAIWLFAKKAGTIRRNIFLGKQESLNDQPRKRIRNLLLLALGQKKMFKNPIAKCKNFGKF